MKSNSASGVWTIMFLMVIAIGFLPIWGAIIVGLLLPFLIAVGVPIILTWAFIVWVSPRRSRK